MKTIKITVAMAVAMAAVGCGGQDVDYDTMPEPTATESAPTPTPVPNAAPSRPELTLSQTTARAGDVLTIDASSTDPDGDAIVYHWSAVVNDADGTSVVALSSSTGATVSLSAPITNGLGSVRVSCEAIDAKEARSSIGEAFVTVNPIVLDGGNFDDRLTPVDICRQAPELCAAFPNLANTVMDTHIPNINDLRDEYVGAVTTLPLGDYDARFSVALTPNGTLLAALGTGSIDMIVGANGKGGGYRLRLFAVPMGLFGQVQWRYEILPLASNAFEPATVLAPASSPVLSGVIGATPSTITARYENGSLQFSVNGAALPAFAATNMNSTRVSIGTFQSSASFSNVQVTMLK